MLRETTESLRVPFAALCLAFAVHGWAGATLERVTHSRVLNDVLLNTYPPFGFIDADNELAGFDVDVARAFAARLGVTLKLATPSWETIVSGHWQGRWDLCICSMSPTDERAQVLSFPVRYYSSPRGSDGAQGRTAHPIDRRRLRQAGRRGNRLEL